MSSYSLEVVERAEKGDPKLVRAIELYMRQDFVSLNGHLKQRVLELQDKLRRRVCIYLDQKYWIYLRDAKAGTAQRKCHKKLLRLFEDLLADDRIICPVSSSTLSESLKIHVPERLKATARIIDEFSQGIAIRPMDERIRLEFFEAWDRRSSTSSNIRAARHFVWTTPALVDGLPLGTPPDNFPPSTAIAIGKTIVDELVSMSFSKSLEFLLRAEPGISDTVNRVVAAINDGRQEVQGNGLTFKVEFPRECADFITGGGLIEDGRIEEPVYHPYTQPDECLAVEVPEVFEFLLALTKRVALESEAGAFPSMYIWSGLHAVGKTTDSKYEANDIMDFDHACAAVPYCDAFLTERRLARWLRQKPLSVMDHFDCEIFGNDDDAIAYLESLC